MEASIFVVLVLLVSLAALAFWIWTLVDVVKVPSDDHFRAGTQLVWVLVIVLTQVLGSIIYLAVGRPAAGHRR